MKKTELDGQLDRNKLIVVKFAFLINLIITVIMIFALLSLKIDSQPILNMALKYYLNKK